MAPKAVCISDIHFNLTTYPVAAAALTQALRKAEELRVPLIIAGDIHDSKANMRGECVKSMIDVLASATTPVLLLVANHDRINEKSKEHSLEFLKPYTYVINTPEFYPGLGFYFIPYEHDTEALRAYLKTVPPGSTLIMHQGISGSNAGEYIQDKSAINKEDVENFRVISGHYHTRQDIKTGRPRKGAIGLWSYIGNPYTLNFAESKDPDKGFQILMDDGLLEFVPTNLRKHVVIEIQTTRGECWDTKSPNPGDFVLVKLHGTSGYLSTVSKVEVGRKLNLAENFRLDLIPEDETITAPEVKNLSQPDLLDQLIESLTSAPMDQKNRLKALWKGL